MTATARYARPVAGTRRPQQAKVVATAKTSRSGQALMYILGLVGFLLALIVAAIVINTQAAVLSYEIHDTQTKLAKLRQDNEELRIQIEQASSANQLRQVAEKEGMVPAGEIGYITLATKQIVGGTAAAPPPAPPAADEETAVKDE